MFSPSLEPPSRHDKLNSYRGVIALLDEFAPGSAEFGACQLLLALRREVQSVDRLAARLGLPRHFVAQCMRRLVDSGVIEEGRLVCAWATDPLDPESFRADMNVALGKWVRRVDGSGVLRWAEAGALTKKYDYLEGPEDERNRTHFLDVTLAEGAELEVMRARLPAREPRWLGAAVVAESMLAFAGSRIAPVSDDAPATEDGAWIATEEILCQRGIDATMTEVVWLA